MTTQLESGTQKAIRNFNFELLVAMLLIFGYGMLTLNAATKGPEIQSLVKSQLLWFGVGGLLAVGLVFIDTEMLQRVSYLIYVGTIALLLLVVLIGKVGGGSQRWINLGFFHLQPSELSKIATVFAFARFFAQDRTGGPYSLRRLVFPSLLLLPSFMLIVLQPDIGTAGIVFLTAASMVLFLGVHVRSLIIVGLIGLVTVPMSYHFLLKDYQRKRVITFLNPGSDPRGSGYNALQCKIAVGSGKWFGKGYLQGTQSQLNFIPEQHTDFIFSVLAEERGFVGTVVLLVFYFLYLSFGLNTLSKARDKYEMLVVFGMVAICFWHVFINIGMVIGILPVVGVTLPFFSYGGSSLITFLMSTALILNISRKRYIF